MANVQGTPVNPAEHRPIQGNEAAFDQRALIPEENLENRVDNIAMPHVKEAGNDAKRVDQGIDDNADLTAEQKERPLHGLEENVENAIKQGPPLDVVLNQGAQGDQPEQPAVPPPQEQNAEPQQPVQPQPAPLPQPDQPQQPALQKIQVQQAANIINDADEAVKNIEAMIKANDPKLSTSELLKQLYDIAKVFGGDISSSTLKTDQGRFVTEPFTSTENPGETFYKIEATYTISIPGKDDLKLKRYIKSSATEPETLILFASKYKDMRVELAKASNGQLGRLNLAQGESIEDLRKQSVFTFKGSLDQTTGHVYRLDSISSLVKGKTSEFKLNEKTGDEVYVQSGSHAFVPKQQKDVKSDVYGQVVYKTEDEYLTHASYVVKMPEGSNIYDEFEKDQKTELRLKEIKEQIEKKEAQLTEAKAQFTNDSWTRWLSGKTPAEFKQFLDDVKAEKYLKEKEVRKSLNQIKVAHPHGEDYNLEEQTIIADLMRIYDLRTKYPKRFDKIPLETADYNHAVDILIETMKKEAKSNDVSGISETMQQYMQLKKAQGRYAPPALLKTNQIFIDKNPEYRQLADLEEQLSQKPPLDDLQKARVKNLMGPDGKFQEYANDAKPIDNVAIQELIKRKFETDLAKLQEQITQQKSRYNMRLGQLNKLNSDLESLVGQLEGLKIGAEAKKNHPSTLEELKRAEAFLKSLPNIKKLNDKVKKNKDDADDILEKITALGVGRVPRQEEILLGDAI